jgi:uncharacterized protein YxjI
MSTVSAPFAPNHRHPAHPGAPVDHSWERWLATRFAWTRLTVRQKLLTIAQRYVVCDEADRPLFYVVRPPKLALNIAANLCGGLVRLLFFVLAFTTFMRGDIVTAVALLITGGILATVVVMLMVPYRDIRVFADEAEQYPLMLMTQDNKIGWYLRYTIHDPLGHPVAVARRNVLLAMVRRNWEAVTLDGRTIVRVIEDSLLLALLRRYLGPLWGLLRTNFDIQLPNGTRIGEYNRKMTLTDQYILDLKGDPYYLVDRRVALGLAILLDTAEGR